MVRTPSSKSVLVNVGIVCAEEAPVDSMSRNVCQDESDCRPHYR